MVGASGKERTSSAPSAWVNIRVCTPTRNEVEDEVVQKVVYSINGTAQTCPAIHARLPDLTPSKQLR